MSGCTGTVTTEQVGQYIEDEDCFEVVVCSKAYQNQIYCLFGLFVSLLLWL